jgi:hypothetical protein
MKLSLPPIALVLAGVLALGSCGGGPSATTPDGAVMKSVQALRANDLPTLMETAFTDAELAKMQTEWSSQMLEAPAADEQARFATTMEMLLAPDAESALMQKLEPELAKLAPQVDMLLGMIEGLAANAVASNATMTAQEQTQGRQVVQALVTTLRQNDITDPGRARKAVGIVCSAARKLGVKTVADVQSLTFDQGLERGNVLLACTKDVLAVYGFSIDSLLESVQARTVMQSGDAATVEIRYTLLGVEHTQQAEMMRVFGRWVVRRGPDAAPAELKSGIGG